MWRYCEIILFCPSFSDFEEVEVASSVSSSEDTQEQPTSSSMVPNDAGHNILSALLKVKIYLHSVVPFCFETQNVCVYYGCFAI
jgi:hypothetical protein